MKFVVLIALSLLVVFCSSNDIDPVLYPNINDSAHASVSQQNSSATSSGHSVSNSSGESNSANSSFTSSQGASVSGRTLENYTFVSPQGSLQTGNGTINAPYRFDYIVANAQNILPGDTIVLTQGVYRGNFIFEFNGAPDAPIVIMALPGETATIEAIENSDTPAIIFRGSHTIIQSITIRSVNPSRNSVTGEVHGASGVDIFGSNNKLINCIIHDNTGGGVGFWSSAEDAKIYGSIIFNNGFQGPNRGHGHGIYAQNLTGTKTISNNIIFNTFGQGIQIYSEAGSIEGFLIEGNILFNCGILSQTLERGVLVGGLRPAARIEIRNNLFYQNAPVRASAALQLGYSSNNIDAIVENNYIAGGSPAISILTPWESLSIENNTLINYSRNLLMHDNAVNSNYFFENNVYYQGSVNSMDFADWQNRYGHDLSGSFNNFLPQTNEIFVFANSYEQARAHVAVYNWEQLQSVVVDLRDIFSIGDSIIVRDVQNMQGDAVFRGAYTGGLVLSMAENQVQAPFGNVGYIPEHTAPLFAVFLVTKSN